MTNEEHDQYQDILYTAYSVAAGREMVKQYKAEGLVHDNESATDAGIQAVAAQILRDVIAHLDTFEWRTPSGFVAYPSDVIERFATDRGIGLEDDE